jgi:hypothetical protein
MGSGRRVGEWFGFVFGFMFGLDGCGTEIGTDTGCWCGLGGE